MKRTVSLGACLLTSCVLQAIVVAGSSAASLPEFSKLGATLTSPLSAGFLEANGQKVACTSGEDAGAIISPTRIELAIIYRGCEDKSLGTCTTPSLSAGEIATRGLFGDTGYLKAESTEAGLDFSPREAGAPWMEFTCGTTSFLIGPEGSETAIGKITPVNLSNKKFLIEFKCVAGEKQQYKKLLNKKGVVEREGELKAVIGGKAVQACLNSNVELKFTEARELIA